MSLNYDIIFLGLAYRDCHVKTTPCHDVDCPGGTECYTIDPPEECIGCDVETDCRPIGNYKY